MALKTSDFGRLELGYLPDQAMVGWQASNPTMVIFFTAWDWTRLPR